MQLKKRMFMKDERQEEMTLKQKLKLVFDDDLRTKSPGWKNWVDYGIIGLIHILASAFLPVLLPSTAKVLARKDKQAYYRVAYDGTKYISIILCFCTFGMMMVGTDALSLYVGEKYDISNQVLEMMGIKPTSTPDADNAAPAPASSGKSDNNAGSSRGGSRKEVR